MIALTPILLGTLQMNSPIGHAENQTTKFTWPGAGLSDTRHFALRQQPLGAMASNSLPLASGPNRRAAGHAEAIF